MYLYVPNIRIRQPSSLILFNIHQNCMRNILKYRNSLLSLTFEQVD